MVTLFMHERFDIKRIDVIDEVYTPFLRNILDMFCLRCIDNLRINRYLLAVSIYSIPIAIYEMFLKTNIRSHQSKLFNIIVFLSSILFKLFLIIIESIYKLFLIIIESIYKFFLIITITSIIKKRKTLYMRTDTTKRERAKS